jgi:uncharacterized protein (TIGR04255 family)
MARAQKRYKSAPIMEAVIEVRLAPVESFKDEWLKELGASLRSRFPKQVEMRRVEMGFAFGAGADQQANFRTHNTPFGLRLSKDDDSRILQIRRDGFAYSHLAPYTDWATFRGEAYPLWEQYRKVAAGGALARCGLRYINRIEIPGERVEIEDYFALYPKIPAAMPNPDIAGMLMNLTLPQPDLECGATITQALTDPAKKDHMSVILDIDLFRENLVKWSDSEVWSYFDKLRHRKNEMFEGCITDRTRELIDK